MRRLAAFGLFGIWSFVLMACGGSAAIERDPTSCRSDNECMLAANACCGPCEPYDASAVTAINRNYAVDFHAQHCPSGGTCGQCAPSDSLAATGKFLRAECQASKCVTVDVRTTAITECAGPADCVLRDGVDCCADCNGEGWVAVSKNAELCSGQSVACPKCLSAPSLYMGSGCNVSTGRCEYGELR